MSKKSKNNNSYFGKGALFMLGIFCISLMVIGVYAFVEPTVGNGPNDQNSYIDSNSLLMKILKGIEAKVQGIESNIELMNSRIDSINQTMNTNPINTASGAEKQDGNYYSVGGDNAYCKKETIISGVKQYINVNDFRMCDSKNNYSCYFGKCGLTPAIKEIDYHHVLMEDGTLAYWGGESNINGGKYSLTFIINNVKHYDGGSCAVLEDKTIKCWGTNGLPAENVIGINNAKKVISGEWHSGKSYNCAVLEDKTIKCWGDGSSPVNVVGINNAKDVISSYGYICALLEDKTIKCWGEVSSPVSVVGINNAKDVVLKGSHNCALLEDKTIKCWGSNDRGQLGDGTTTASSSSVNVIGINNAKDVILGQNYACALLEDKTIKCWGANYNGQLGDGTTTASSSPVSVIGINNAKNVVLSGNYACALLEDKTIKCWGANNYGQLGNGVKYPGTFESLPVNVIGINNAKDIMMVSEGVCAFLENNDFKCWGSNRLGQLMIDRKTLTCGYGTGGFAVSCSSTPI